MSRRFKLSSVGVFAAAFVLLLGAVSPVFGQAKKRYKEQIKEYSKQLDGLKKRDEWGASKEDRTRARQWLAEAKELLAQGDTDTAGWLVTRTSDAIDLISALVRAKEIEAMADDQEKTYHQIKEERIPELEADIEKLQERKRKLKNEL